jgi:hypothetical protein
MLKDVIKTDIPWTLGDIPEGWEWFAFTFKCRTTWNLTAGVLARPGGCRYE